MGRDVRLSLMGLFEAELPGWRRIRNPQAWSPARGGKKKKKPASKTYRQLKASVERVFSRAKRLLNLENLHVRCLKSISIWVYLVFTAMLAAAAAARGNGLEKRIRCIRSAFG